MAPTFVHLHLHSEYSLANSVIRIKDLIGHCRKLRMPALALTDQANLFGVVKFFKAAIKAGVKPIIGVDAWIEQEQNLTHPARLLLLAKDRDGYTNICRLLSMGYRDAQHNGKACIRKSWLAEHSAGLIALSGGLQGELGQALMHATPKRATQLADGYARMFPNRFYLEIQRVGKAQEEQYIDAAVELAANRGLPVVATNDVHFLSARDHAIHEARVCIHEGRVLNDQRRSRDFTTQQYFRDPEEMVALFADIPEAIENTLEIAKRCNFQLEMGTDHLPDFPMPERESVDDKLIDLAHAGLKQRLAETSAAAAVDHDDYGRRLELELDVIIRKGFPGYFLIVADFVKWAKSNHIPVGPGRGSGAGSLVAWSLGITELDPLAHGLLFERFLNLERVDLPDIDIDFCMDGRDKVIEYVANRYGHTKVSQIITHGTMAARAVVRDVGRVLGMPYGQVDKIAKLIPFEIGMTLEKALKQEQLLREQRDEDADVKELLQIARGLEGLSRNVGKHAGGVVIAPSALTDFTAMYCEQGGEHMITHFDKDDLEAIGLVKFDFLGLRTLTIIDRALTKINARLQSAGTPGVSLQHLTMDDPATYELIKSCRTTALFQLESRGMKDLIKRLKPDSFDDLVALVALFRPGPLQSGMVDDFIDRKHGRSRITYTHPMLEAILKPTYGVILYQEQVMEIARVMAGYSLGQADLLRSAMGKKKAVEMARHREGFVTGAAANDIKQDTATSIFDLMEKFAGYGFNKSHSAAYATITYQTAWLKTHYVADYMAASISADMENTDRVVTLIAECREIGVQVLHPDVNLCDYQFSVLDQKRIAYGLGAIKGIGYGVIEAIVDAREKDGRFEDLFDLCIRVDLRKVNRRAFESLIQAGALDGLGAHRAALLATLPLALSLAGQQTQDRDAGQNDLFGIDTPQSVSRTYTEAVEWSKEQVLNAEKETLGLYLSGHPIDRYRGDLDQIVHARLADLNPEHDRTLIVAGLIVALRTMNTRRGDRMAFVTLDDQTARLELAVFADLFAEKRDLIRKDNLVVVQGQVSMDDYTGGYKMAADALFDIESARATFADKMILALVQGDATAAMIERLSHVLENATRGSCRVLVRYTSERAQCQFTLGDRYGVAVDSHLLENVRQVVGADNLRIEYRNLPVEQPAEHRPINPEAVESAA